MKENNSLTITIKITNQKRKSIGGKELKTNSLSLCCSLKPFSFWKARRQRQNWSKHSLTSVWTQCGPCREQYGQSAGLYDRLRHLPVIEFLMYWSMHTTNKPRRCIWEFFKSFFYTFTISLLSVPKKVVFKLQQHPISCEMALLFEPVILKEEYLERGMCEGNNTQR